MEIFLGNNYKYDIIIVGAGISGLFIAYKLSKLGLKILIVESSSYLGGRIYTKYMKNIQYECGAARFHKSHSKLLSLIHELELEGDIVRLPETIKHNLRNKKKDYTYNTDSKLDLLELLAIAFENKDKLPQKNLLTMTFFQYLVLLFDHETACFIKDTFGYDSELLDLNAYSALEMFKNDFLKDNEYYVLGHGLSQVINKLEEEINKCDTIIIKKECTVLEVDKESITVDNGDKFYFNHLILTIPPTKLTTIDYFKENKLLTTVKPIQLLRIYAQYPTEDLWFKDIQRTTTDNILRQIIPIDYEKGLIMISYTDGKNASMWKSYKDIGDSFLIKALHKEISTLFDIVPPKPKMISVHYWENGVHMWDVGSNLNKLYPCIIKPNLEEEIYIGGEAYSKKQGWIEGSLETAYDILKILPLKGVRVSKIDDKSQE
tara:strand:- start:1072 stop:2367 length:1296 start_codon:yes stop_codon:yes gene_type:complete